jgi:hypothetical protein
MATYKQLDNKASKIITKLQNKINSGKIYENQGQKELRQFKDLVSATDMTYPEKYQLTSMLSTRIDNLNYFN